MQHRTYFGYQSEHDPLTYVLLWTWVSLLGLMNRTAITAIILGQTGAAVNRGTVTFP